MHVRRFVLYSVTMFVELISVSVRFAFVSAVAMLFVRREVAVALGALAALGPVIAALVVLAGVPSGHRFVRRSLGARPLTPDEQRRLERAVQPIRAQGITLPRRIFTVPERGLNAAVSGRTLYIFQDLYASPYLAGIVAHELGHYHSLDGRMLLALRSLTVPGGFLFVYLMLQMLRGLAYIVRLRPSSPCSSSAQRSSSTCKPALPPPVLSPRSAQPQPWACRACSGLMRSRPALSA
jgi:Zn-dependent protease with chaperone function